MALPLRDDVAHRGIPWATWGLMLACVVAFVFLQPAAFQRVHTPSDIERNLADHFEAQRFIDRWALIPCEVTHLKSMHDGAACGGFASDHPERYPAKRPLLPLLTAMFLHGSLTHLAGNLLFLWVFGRAVEARAGPGGLVLLYLLGGVVAGLGFVALRSEATVPMLGASGAIAAVMGAYLVLEPSQRVLSIVYAAGLQVVYVPAWVVLGLFFVTQFFTPGSSHVAWQAHVAGMVGGALMGLALRRWGRLYPALTRRPASVPHS